MNLNKILKTVKAVVKIFLILGLSKIVINKITLKYFSPILINNPTFYYFKNNMCLLKYFVNWKLRI